MHSRGALPFGAPLTGWAIRNHLTFKGKCQIFHLGRNNSMHQYGFSSKWLESRLAEKIWRSWWISWTWACTMANSGLISTRETMAHWSKSNKDTLRWLKDWRTFQTRKGLVRSDGLVWREENWGVGISRAGRLRQTDCCIWHPQTGPRDTDHILKQETPLKHKNKFISFFYCRSKLLEQNAQRGHGISSPGDIQNSIVHETQQAVVDDFAWSWMMSKGCMQP